MLPMPMRIRFKAIQFDSFRNSIESIDTSDLTVITIIKDMLKIAFQFESIDSDSIDCFIYSNVDSFRTR